jgi:hypothetical protein
LLITYFSAIFRRFSLAGDTLRIEGLLDGHGTFFGIIFKIGRFIVLSEDFEFALSESHNSDEHGLRKQRVCGCADLYPELTHTE